MQNGNMIINFSDAEWTGKVVGLVIGWMFCLIPFIIAIIGCLRQLELPTSIGNDIQMIVGGLIS